tara:strand:- start:543 stop:1013 length:471 start_codon:yes stop_codon:yes gene_type:complete
MKLKILTLIMFLLVNQSFGHTGSFEICKSIEDDQKRLSCFDNLDLSFNQTVPTKTNSNEKLNKTAVPEKEINKDFGLPRERDNYEKIVSKIETLRNPNKQKLYFTLTNGQTWRSVENIRRVQFKVGQEVEITEGFISGYKLKVLNKKLSLRVRRID